MCIGKILLGTQDFCFGQGYSLCQSYIPTTMQAPTQHNTAILKTHRNKAWLLSGHFLRPGNGEREAVREKEQVKCWIFDKK